MYALCPHCNQTQLLTPEDYKRQQGWVECCFCHQEFNALESLSDTRHGAEDSPEQNHEIFAWQKTHPEHQGLWISACLIGVLLFIAQIYYFLGDTFTQNRHTRPLLETVSRVLNYPLAPYNNVQDFSIIGSSLNELPNKQLQLFVSFSNHANFAQPLPHLQLNLNKLDGEVFSQRLFSPADYLPADQATNLIASNASIEISLLMALPLTHVAGYSVDLR